jgi:MFS family permease
MLAALAPAGQRGRIFGYHRAMDHTGAVIGPLVAAGFLWVFPDQYRTLFALTIVPGVLAVITLTFVHEPAVPPMRQTKTKTHDIKHEAPDARVERQPVGLGSPLGRYLLILAVFTIGNSTDAFLLLRLSDAGLAAVFLPLAWSALHVVKSSLSTLGGTLSDRVGRRRMIVAGWLFYAVVYVGFALADSLAALLVWLGLYGLHFAMVEGSEKALVADLTPHHLQGTAFGWYNAMLGVGALAASVLFGVLWERFGPPAAFLTGAGLAIIASVLLAMDSRLGAPAAQRASV